MVTVHHLADRIHKKPGNISMKLVIFSKSVHFIIKLMFFVKPLLILLFFINDFKIPKPYSTFSRIIVKNVIYVLLIEIVL